MGISEMNRPFLVKWKDLMKICVYKHINHYTTQEHSTCSTTIKYSKPESSTFFTSLILISGGLSFPMVISHVSHTQFEFEFSLRYLHRGISVW